MKNDKKVEEVKKVTKKEEKEENLLTSVLELIGIIIAIVLILVFFKDTPAWTIVVLLLMLSLLIFIHEGGHFIAAKIFKVHVYEFSLGMGPKILGFKRKGDPTEYNLRAFPIGGYCALAGEEGEDDASLKKDAFLCNKPKLQRLVILVAGVTMNFILAIFLLFGLGLAKGVPTYNNQIDVVTEGTAAYEEGIRPGDKILELNGHKIDTWDDLTLYSALKNKNSYDIYLVLKPDGTKKEYQITRRKYVIVDREAEEIKIGENYIEVTEENTVDKIKEQYKLKEAEPVEMIGVSQKGTVERGFMVSLKYAFVKMFSLMKLMVRIVGYLIIGKLSLTNLSGPVGMYTVVNSAAAAGGFANLVYLAAYLSINLGILNILPFPAFDGGRVLFVLIEAITRKKVDPKVEGMFHSVGFFLLLLLMIYITFQDIMKLI